MQNRAFSLCGGNRSESPGVEEVIIGEENTTRELNRELSELRAYYIETLRKPQIY